MLTNFDEVLRTCYKAKKIFEEKNLVKDGNGYRVKMKTAEGELLELEITDKELQYFSFQVTELLDTKKVYLRGKTKEGLNKMLTLTFSPFLAEWRALEVKEVKG